MTNAVPFHSAANSDPKPFVPINAPDIRTFAIAQMGVAMAVDRTDPTRPLREFRMSLGAPGDGVFQPKLTLAADMPKVAEAVMAGAIDLGVFNPSGCLTMAYRGLGPYPEPLPVRAIGVMPSLDWQVFAVSNRFGIKSVAEIGQKQLPLRISVRTDPRNPTRFVVDEVLAAYGFSTKDIEK